MDPDTDALLHVKGTLPAEYELGELEVHRGAPRKYRIGLKARHSSQAGQPLLQWHSRTFTTKSARRRDRAAESQACRTITAQTWLDLAAKTIQHEAIQQPPSRERGPGEKKDLSMSMEHVLGEQRDFKEVDSSLVLLMRRHGGVCVMLPKYHCECNPIELVWGCAKDWTRQNCTYSMECLRKNVPLSFRPEKDRQAIAVVQAFCKKAYTHALVYLKARALGPTGKEIYKKFKSHRRPTPNTWRK
ncbi:unnamed protein product [Ectocarpus sp. CCAP 1310/34]|nr:unnamed protein product [Ectocarpus sp. CCAP 1310/34]